MGSAAYAPERDAMVWKIKSFPGGKVSPDSVSCEYFGPLFMLGLNCSNSLELLYQEYMCRAEFSLPSITSEEATPEKKAPIRVKFEIPYFTVSGIQVPYQLLLYIRYQLTCLGLSLASCSNIMSYFSGTLPESHREEWIPGPSLGQIHHNGW